MDTSEKELPEELKRLEIFAEKVFRGVPGLVAAIKKKIGKKVNIRSYFDKKAAPGKKLLTDLEIIGCNGEWIRTGNNSMFANNDAGRVLAEKFGEPMIGYIHPALEGMKASTVVREVKKEITPAEARSFKSRLIILEHTMETALSEVREMLQELEAKEGATDA